MHHFEYKLGLSSLKYLPFLTTLLINITIILNLIGINNTVLVYFTSTAIIPTIILLFISNTLKFCYIHKAFIVYNLLCDMVYKFTNYSILSLNIVVLLIGIVLWILLTIKSAKKDNFGIIKK